MKKMFFAVLVGAFILSSWIVLAEDRKLITSDEFVKKLSEQPEKKSQQLRLRGLKNIKPRPPEVTVHVLFKFGSTKIADDFSQAQLDEAGKALSCEVLSKYRFEIAGHTDSIGSTEFNLNLSQQRAKVIKKYLFEKYDISDKRLEVKGYGESMPVGSNDTETGRAKNRRVVFKRIDQ